MQYKNKTFINCLIGLQILTLIFGIYNFYFSGNLLFLVAIIISATLLYLIFTKDEYVIIGIKIWSGIIIFGQAMGLVSSCAACVHVVSGGTEVGPEYYSISKLSQIILLGALGLYYFLNANKYIVEIKNDDPDLTVSN
jgi:hypothetical protein